LRKKAFNKAAAVKPLDHLIQDFIAREGGARERERESERERERCVTFLMRSH
jgi:hypothetical protein